MTAVEQQEIESPIKHAAVEQAKSAARARGKDSGPTILPHLEHFVVLTRKVQRPSLIRGLLEAAHGQALPAVQALTDTAEGSLPIPSRNAVFAVVSAMFNGKHVHYQKVTNGAAADIDDAAVTNVRYSWHSGKGELSVFCDDESVRPELAKVFRDVVLGGDGDIQSMPMREFDLMGFCTPAMLSRFKKDRIDGVESIDIKHLVVAKPEVRKTTQRSRLVERRVENALVIKRDRFEDRNIYDMAQEVHHIDDLTDYVIKQARLTMRIAKTSYRKAHDVSVQITAPNGFNDRRLTKNDSELVFAQLMQIDCARQY